MLLYVCKQTFRKLCRYITWESLGLRMRNFRIVFLYEREHIWRFSNLHQCTFLNWFMFGKKTTQNLKSSHLRYFKEKNQKIWNVNSSMVFPWFYVKKKNSIFDFRQKKVLYNLKFSLRVSLTQENAFSYRFHFWSQQKDIDTSKKRC